MLEWQLRRELPHSDFVFLSERGAPFSEAGFVKMVERAGVVPGLGLKVHPHMLRHACGYKLANEGRDTRSIQDYLHSTYGPVHRTGAKPVQGFLAVGRATAWQNAAIWNRLGGGIR
jgi:integrase